MARRLPAHSVKRRRDPDALGNRRTRLSPTIGKTLTDWLHRTTRVHAHLLNVVRLYGKENANRLETDEWRLRALAGDRTILCDAVSAASDTLRAIANEIERAMQAAAPTDAAPGTQQKIRVLRRRVSRFQTLWIEGDTTADAPDLPPVQES